MAPLAAKTANFSALSDRGMVFMPFTKAASAIGPSNIWVTVANAVLLSASLALC
jgi:hypothetical protein